jgi:hypothetical protein
MLRQMALLATALAVAAVAAACGTSGGGSARHLDARALVAQPRDVGGLRGVTGSWNELADGLVSPLADALGGTSAPPRNIAFVAEYAGLAGRALGADVDALAVVLPDAAAARRLLGFTGGVEGFVGGGAADVSKAAPPGDADAAVAGAAAHGTVTGAPVAVTAWTKGRLYGYVWASGPSARSLVARVASAEESRFERALGGDRMAFDALLRPVVPVAPPRPGAGAAGRVIHPAGPVPRIARAGRYTLPDLGAGTLTFSPAAGVAGAQFPVELALPHSARGRWLWRITTHVIVKLAPHAPLGRLGVEPHIANVGGPGAGFVVVRDLSNGRTYLIEETKHTTTTRSLEVRTSAMMGGNPSPRQQALFGFAVSSFYGADKAIESVTVLPDSAIEVFDDPAKIGCCAITTSVSKAVR